MSLSSKTVVVTGSASGIGAAVAAQIREEGVHVIGVDRHPSRNADQSIIGELSTRHGVDATLAQLPDGAMGLCNVAGIAPTNPGKKVLAVNFMAVRHLTLGYVDRMADGGSIVNVASLAAHRWRQNRAEIDGLLACDWETVDAFVEDHQLGSGHRNYDLSKEAVVVWTLQNRWTWRERGIRMNAVSPGPTETPIYPDFVSTLGERVVNAERMMDRLGRPTDIAPVVAFLLSDDSAWIRGAEIAVDGGMAAYNALRPTE